MLIWPDSDAVGKKKKKEKKRKGRKRKEEEGKILKIYFQ
jgi:hypothetical protein